MTKVVFNNCFGGFGLSEAAVRRAREITNNSFWGEVTLPGETYPDSKEVCDGNYNSYHPRVERHDKVLVQVIEELSDKANGACAELKIVEVPTVYRIEEYDGAESVATPETDSWTDPRV